MWVRCYFTGKNLGGKQWVTAKESVVFVIRLPLKSAPYVGRITVINVLKRMNVVKIM